MNLHRSWNEKPNEYSAVPRYLNCYPGSSLFEWRVGLDATLGLHPSFFRLGGRIL